jgi:hypothetical protein
VDRVLGEFLDDQALLRLREVQRELQVRVPLGSILLAESRQELDKTSVEGLKIAAEYYIEAGILIWRGLGHDYDRLLTLSSVSSSTLESELFDHATQIRRWVFVKTMASLRVVNKVGEWLILTEGRKRPEERCPPLEYFTWFLVGTFLLSCILAHARGQDARYSNIREIAIGLAAVARKAYRQAVHQQIYEGTDKETVWFWSPRWQEGEARADLDKSLGRTSAATSWEKLVRQLER